MAEDPELGVIDSIYDALEGGEAQRALELAREALARQQEEDPVLRFLAGVALGDLDRPGAAAEQLARAVALDPEDPDFRGELALALFRRCRFDEARPHVARCLELDARHGDARYLSGLLRERAGDYEGADADFRSAAEIDPSRFPLPTRLDEAAFEAALQRARAHLPETFRKHLDRVGLITEAIPSDTLLHEEDPPLDPELLGLFSGVPLDQQSYLSPGGELPARIYLFRRNLERFAPDPDELIEQIAVTLYHELGHYLGMEEEDLEELDFA